MSSELYVCLNIGQRSEPTDAEKKLMNDNLDEGAKERELSGRSFASTEHMRFKSGTDERLFYIFRHYND